MPGSAPLQKPHSPIHLRGKMATPRAKQALITLLLQLFPEKSSSARSDFRSFVNALQEEPTILSSLPNTRLAPMIDIVEQLVEHLDRNGKIDSKFWACLSRKFGKRWMAINKVKQMYMPYQHYPPEDLPKISELKDSVLAAQRSAEGFNPDHLFAAHELVIEVELYLRQGISKYSTTDSEQLYEKCSQVRRIVQRKQATRRVATVAALIPVYELVKAVLGSADTAAKWATANWKALSTTTVGVTIATVTVWQTLPSPQFEDGTLMACSLNRFGQLSCDSTGMHQVYGRHANAPKGVAAQVNDSKKRLYTKISVGHAGVCGLALQGTVDCFGYAAELVGDGGPNYLQRVTETLGVGSEVLGILDTYEPSTRGPSSLEEELFSTSRSHFRTVRMEHAPRDQVFEQLDVGRQACGILEDSNEVVCWPEHPDWGAPPRGEFSSIAVGHHQACGITAETDVKCWSEAGPDKARNHEPEGQGWVKVSVEDMVSCAMHETGRVYCWQWDGSTFSPDTSHFTPTDVAVCIGTYCVADEHGKAHCGRIGSSDIWPRGELADIEATCGANWLCGAAAGDSGQCITFPEARAFLSNKSTWSTSGS